MIKKKRSSFREGKKKKRRERKLGGGGGGGGGGEKCIEIVKQSAVDECCTGEHTRLAVNEVLGKYVGENGVSA